ncbi:uncharacterized protein LOC117303911 isoform X2 [Asterias rubens]|uniref:uncharacterized protein LOC117303911 isoform X2 n=1 Tax=Asterias rubens TaxID=7604 RepID=UPI001455603A|nr:uncharacterized protein LOC117303911 isoform X2 [Asterias rubens]
METVDNKPPAANGIEDDAIKGNQRPTMTSVDWEMTANAYEDELEELRPLRVENRRLRRCVGGVRVLGRALKDSKGEVHRLRGLLADKDLHPDDTDDKHATSTDKPQVTLDDETLGDTEDDIEGAIEAEYVMTSPRDEDGGAGERDDAEGAIEEMELIGELSKLEGVGQTEYYSTTLLKKANTEWKNHLKHKESDLIAELSKKDETIGGLQTELNDAVKEADIKANHYEQTLLTAKTRIELIEDENQRLKKAVSKEQQKNDKSEMFNRTLIKQNTSMTDEIVRLKQALEKKYHQHVHVNQSPSTETAATFVKQSIGSTESSKTGRNHDSQQEPNTVERKTPVHLPTTAPMPLKTHMHRPTTSPMPLKTPKHLPTTAPMPLKAPADEEKQDDCLTASQYQTVTEKNKQPQENVSKVTDKSLSKQDMKEQVELLRHQNQMYESDFKKERADRQKARDEIQTLRHQISKQKKQTKDQIKDDVKTKGPPKHGAYRPSDQKIEAEPSRRDHNKLKVKSSRTPHKDVVKPSHKATSKVSTGSQVIMLQPGPEGRWLQINLQAESDTVRGRSGVPARQDPYVCPRCQKMFTESEWDSFEHHVTLCMR